MDKRLTCACTAVDPVAVLAVFEDVEADRALYFLVCLQCIFYSLGLVYQLFFLGVWRGAPLHPSYVRGGDGTSLGGPH